MTVHVGLLLLTLEIPSAMSLKDKRRVLKSLIDRARRELQVSIAEVGFQNHLRSATIAIAFVGNSQAVIERARAKAELLLSDDPRVNTLEISWEWL